MPPVLLLTGATGFLGNRLVRLLQDRGLPPDRLRCLVRDRDRALRAGIPASSIRLGDLGDANGGPGLAAAADGADVVFHLAAELKGWRGGAFAAVNVGGTERLLRAASAAAPAAHFVLVSSLAAAGPSIDGVGTDAMPAACRPVSAYGESKRDAELRVVAGPAPWTIVRPPVVYGPGDGATRLLFRQACAPVTAVPLRTRPLSVIHVDDVAEALLRIATVRPAGAVLPLDGPERSDTHAFVRAIAAASGRRARLLPVPMAVAALGAAASDALAALRRSAGFFSRDKLREIRACGWVADGGPARERLDFVATTRLAAGLADVARREGFRRGVTAATA
ncbi:MAG: NAD-dependent epimerase/dehydratase family protein [Planctomycetes bacterium]|nr:NAD-dependent epimerase/dehydratase family protein [Planctomycetota bacterium]